MDRVGSKSVTKKPAKAIGEHLRGLRLSNKKTFFPRLPEKG